MRIRSIKPEFWRSQDVTDLDWETRLIFIGLWSYVDDSGVGVADPRSIAADLFALEDDPVGIRTKIEGALVELSRPTREDPSRPLVTFFQVSGKRYLYITQWSAHQKIDRPSKSRLPAPPDPLPPANTGTESKPRASSNKTREPSMLEPGNRVTGEPSNRGAEDPLAPTASPRVRDEIWDALLEACGINGDEVTAAQRGLLNRAVADLKAVRATGADVKIRAGRYRKQMPDVRLTPTALAKHWASLSTAAAPATKPPAKGW